MAKRPGIRPTASSGTTSGSPSVTKFARGAILVEFAIQVKALEDKLDCRGNRRRIGVGLEAGDGGAELRQVADESRVALGRHAFAGFDGEASLEPAEHRFEVANAEVAIEDVENG